MNDLRVGVDVGGTFTKAVAYDAAEDSVTKRAVVPTTHTHEHGVAAGVVEAVTRVAQAVGAERVALVTHSTTQAVNALLEGDVGLVGVLAMGRRPDLRKVERRTRLVGVELSPGRALRTAHEVLDVTDGFDPTAVREALCRLRDGGATAICIAEAFAPDDGGNERVVAELAADLNLPVCTSSELTGLYGLELRTVTAALNAAITPIALRTAGVVEQGVLDAGIRGSIMVMRGDGGATNLAGFRSGPARTLYSGPAASVAGALHRARVTDAVVVEVGGTSTNVAAIRSGRPRMSYVQVATHATAIRALDVRVVGVAGGSMLRVRRRRVYGVGPRSAHIAGLEYSCFAPPEALQDAEAVEVAPSPGDPPDYLIVAAGERRFALTNTCAANLLGVVHTGDYAAGSQEAARAAFRVAGRHLRLDPEEVARRMLEASGRAVAQLVGAAMHDHGLEQPMLVALGGGAGGLGRHVAALCGLECLVPPEAEVISSIGDAMSLVRATREKTMPQPTAESVDALIDDVEREAVDAGAAPASLDVEVEYVADRKALRATASGALGLNVEARPDRPPLDEEAVARLVAEHGAGDPFAVGAYWIARDASQRPARVLVFDRFGDPVVDAAGEVVLVGADDSIDAAVESAVSRHTRNVGPVRVPPSVWVVTGARIAELSSGDVVPPAVALAERGGRDGSAIVIGRG
jgi:N-methylhydantoinase A